MTLKGRRLLLGITGGVAAYKAAALARLLVKAGADVRVVMTEAATRFVTPVTMQALTGQAVWTDLWDPRVPDSMGHIELSRDRDLIAVAPASGNFLGKLAGGLADDLLTTLCLARRCPLMAAPAMNVEMWENPAMQRNLHTLRGDGLLARCIQHEADHLNGILFIDRMDKKVRAAVDPAVRALAKATRDAAKA